MTTSVLVAKDWREAVNYAQAAKLKIFICINEPHTLLGIAEESSVLLIGSYWLNPAWDDIREIMEDRKMKGVIV